MSPKISFISTVYNGSKFFDKALPSVLSQTFQDWEYIICDDGSTDDTREKLYQIAKQDSRIILLNKEGKRMGRTKALNFAISHAKSEYIFQQDWDDTSEPERAYNQLELFSVDKGIGIVAGSSKIIDEIRGEKFIRKAPINLDICIKILSKGVPFDHTIVAFRKAAWNDVGGYDESLDDLEDLNLYIRILSQGWSYASSNEVFGSHFIYKDSYWTSNYRDQDRQRKLARQQVFAVKTFKLASYHYIWPLGRYVYKSLPVNLMKFIRRHLAKVSETDF